MALHKTWPMSTSSTSESDIRVQMPVDLVTIRSSEEVNLLKRAIVEASYHGSVHMVSNPHASKFSPSKIKAKQKPVSKVKAVKPGPQSKKPTKPVLPAPQTVTDDNEKYCLWLEFHDDMSKYLKTTPYPLSGTALAAKQRSSRVSKESKRGIETLRALGITPRGVINTAKGSYAIPFWSTPDLEQIVSSNRSYIKELSVRYCDARSIGAVLPAFRMEGDHVNQSVPKARDDLRIFADQDAVVNASNAALIQVLENQLIAQEKAVNRFNDRVARAEAKVFDLYDIDIHVGDTTRKVGPTVLAPSDAAANESLFDACETQHEKEQWADGNIYDMYELMAMGKMPIDCELVAYVKQLRGDNAQDHGKYLMPVGVYNPEVWMREVEGPAYARWLNNHSSVYDRDSREYAKKQLSPGYCTNTGVDVHILAQINLTSFEAMVAGKQSRRIAMFDYGLLRNDSAANWLRQHMPRKHTAAVSVSMPVITVEQIEAKQDRVIKETLFDNIMNQYESKARFRNWVAYVESQVVPVLTDVVEDTTQMVSDTTIKQDSPTAYAVADPDLSGLKKIPHGNRTAVTAEVVSLADHRDKQQNGVKSLTSLLSVNLKNFLSTLSSDQQEELYELLKASRQG